MSEPSERTIDSETNGFLFQPISPFDPGKLAQLLTDYLRFKHVQGEEQLRPKEQFPNVSPAILESLIRDCYTASQLPEEGLFPKFQVVMSASPRLDIRLRFSPAIPVTAKFFRKIASACPENCALFVSVSANEQLVCEGIVSNLWQQQFQGLGIANIHSYPALCLKVDLPGDLIIGLGSVFYRVKAERADCRLQFPYQHQVYGWYFELASWVDDQIPDMLPVVEDHGVKVSYPPYSLVSNLWSRVLELAQNFKHGGTFVIRPTGCTSDISIKYQASDLHLGKSIVEHYNSVVRDRNLMTSERERLLGYAGLLAKISTVDGCVVLDRELNLLGFGGHIQVDEEELRKNGRTLVNDKNEIISEDQLKEYGARHKSAYRICKAHPNHLAFVISQDGPVTVFASDEKHVYEVYFPDFSPSLEYW